MKFTSLKGKFTNKVHARKMKGFEIRDHIPAVLADHEYINIFNRNTSHLKARSLQTYPRRWGHNLNFFLRKNNFRNNLYSWNKVFQVIKTHIFLKKQAVHKNNHLVDSIMSVFCKQSDAGYSTLQVHRKVQSDSKSGAETIDGRPAFMVCSHLTRHLGVLSCNRPRPNCHGKWSRAIHPQAQRDKYKLALHG